MEKKVLPSQTIGRYTQLDPEVVAKIASAEQVLNSLSAGSRSILDKYCRDLQRTTGLGEEGRNFDKVLWPAIKPWLRNLKDAKEVKEYLRNLVDEEGFLFSRSLKIWKNTSKAFLLFAKPDVPSKRWLRSYRKAKEQLILSMRKVIPGKLKPVIFNTTQDVKDALSKLGANSGWTYVETGNRAKGDNIDYALSCYKAILDGTSTRIENPPVLLGFRTQGSGEFTEFGEYTNTCKHKTRVIFMVDLIDLLLELSFSIPLIEALMRTPWYETGMNVDQVVDRINVMRNNYQYFMSTDFSSFDQTIPGWMIEDCMEINKSFFELTPQMEIIYERVVHNLVYKRLVVPGGFLDILRGMASGKGHTNALDSQCNFLVHVTFFDHLGLKDFDFLICGDDNITCTNQEISLVDFSTYVEHNFGMIIKVDAKTNMGRFRDEDPEFLSRFWEKDGTYRHPRLLLSKLLYSERPRIYAKDWYKHPHCAKVWDKELGQYVSPPTPYHVIECFILEYGRGMRELIDVPAFRAAHPISKSEIESMGTGILPGNLAWHVEQRKVRRRVAGNT